MIEPRNRGFDPKTVGADKAHYIQGRTVILARLLNVFSSGVVVLREHIRVGYGATNWNRDDSPKIPKPERRPKRPRAVKTLFKTSMKRLIILWTFGIKGPFQGL